MIEILIRGYLKTEYDAIFWDKVLFFLVPLSLRDTRERFVNDRNLFKFCSNLANEQFQAVYSLKKHGKSEIFGDFFCIWKNQGNFMEFYWISKITNDASRKCVHPSKRNMRFADAVVTFETHVGSAFLFVVAFDVFVLRISRDEKPVER